jgi:acyl-[acyl-carrier-protein]-phospholipid O-acyltransferase/long-chain-fatty-acid--[acyl-carrier-protein] ligase
MLKLIQTKGFFAFITVAFINAFVDLGHKIIIQNTLFKAYDGSQQVILTAIVNGLILIPFILLLTPAGFLSDRFKKPTVIRWTARLAVVITLLITLSYYQGWFYFAFAMTFILAIQSAIYSPAKYGYIRELVGNEHLSEGNGWVQAVSMIAILCGILVFSLLFESILSPELTNAKPSVIIQDIAPLGWLLVLGALVEAVLAQKLPTTIEDNQQLRFKWPQYLSGELLKSNLKQLVSHYTIIHAIIGIAMFWTVSQVVLAVFPSFAESNLGETNTFVIQAVMALAGIGIMLGSAIAGSSSKNHINLGLIPVGAIGLAIGMVSLPYIDTLSSGALIFFTIGLSGSLMIIPLNALVQFHAEQDKLGQILAGSNFIQNIAMLSGLLLTVLFSLAKYNEEWLLTFLYIITIVTAIYTVTKLPHALVRIIVSVIFKGKYRIHVQGLEHMPAENQGTLLLGNHISWIDWAIVQIACPHKVHFVMEKSIYEQWYLKWFLDICGVIPISATQSKQAIDAIKQRLLEGKVVCLFPEGMISYTGQLSEFKRGFEKSVEGTNAIIIPFYLRGLWGSRFSRSSTRLQEGRRSGIKRDVIVAFGSPLNADTDAAAVKQKVFELSIQTWETHTKSLSSLGDAFIDACKSSNNKWAATDSNATPISSKRLLAGAMLFSQHFKQLPQQNVGLLLPTSSAGLISNIACLMAGKTVVNLNYTASPQAYQSAVEQAGIKTVVSSKRFLGKLKTKGFDTDALTANVTILYLEDLAASFTSRKRSLYFLLASLLPASLLKTIFCKHIENESTAAILFSSGSEGSPKGVMLSHKNIMANLKQTADVLNIQGNDAIMASLPLFHAFGLTVTCFMPLVEGIPVVCHPDPTDAVGIGKAVAKHKVTMLCATATFLRLYSRNRKLHPLMLDSLRLVIAGAEKLPQATRELFENRFHKVILEGYGCTETTPVASVNINDYLNADDWKVQTGHKQGTVGLALPGSTFRIVDPDTLETLATGDEGLILIGGTQIMQGYLNNAEKTAEAIVELDGIRWYKTGDKGKLDEDGFLTIVDRYSRFAKIGGEMISLGEVEQKVRQALNAPEAALVAINLPDAKKGEKIVLLVEGEHDEKQLRQQLLDASMPALLLPTSIYSIEKVPVLGSGKTDFATSRQLAVSLDR